MTTAPVPSRFRDPRFTKHDFVHTILVRCPACDRIAHVAPTPPESVSTPSGLAPARALFGSVSAPSRFAPARAVPGSVSALTGPEPAPDVPHAVASDLFAERRLVCRGCGLSRRWEGRRVVFPGGSRGPAADPYFGLPLWLQTRTRHGVLWAYNPEHLDLIRRYVQAPLRERGPWYEAGRK